MMLRLRTSRLRSLLLRMVGVGAVVILLAIGSLVLRLHNTQSAKASGPNGTVYIHKTTDANISSNYTLLDNSVSNNNPNAVVFVTAVWNPGGGSDTFDNHQVGVEYLDWVGQWAVFNEDGGNMPVGALFSVHAVPGVDNQGTVIVQTATTDNSYITYINDPQTNGKPSTPLLVTQNWNPGDGVGTDNNHAIGVWYDPSFQEWTIYNEDQSPIPLGASFNVAHVPGSTQVATASNTSNESTCIDDPGLNGNPSAPVFITHLYSDYFTDVSALEYNGSQWCVFDGAGNNISIGASFFVTA